MLAACAPAVPALGHGSSLAEVSCPVVPEPLWLDPPERWIDDVDPDYSAYAEWLAASPNRPGTVAVDTRVRALSVADGELLVGIGDFDANPGSLYCPEDGARCPNEDADGHGLPLLGISPGSDGVRTIAVMQTESIGRMRRTGLGVLLPSEDPTLGDPAPDCAAPGAEPGCPEEGARAHPEIWRGRGAQLRDGQVRLGGVVPRAAHVFDLVPMHGVLWALGSAVLNEPADRGAAALWKSMDDGESWSLFWDDRGRRGRSGVRRLRAALPLGDTLLAFGTRVQSGSRSSTVYRLGSESMERLHDLVPPTERVLDSEILDHQTGLVWHASSGRGVPGLAWGISSSGGGLHSWALDIDHHGGVVDAWLLCAGDLLLLTRRSEDWMTIYTVLRTKDLESFEVVGSWESQLAAWRIAWWDGALVVGGEHGGLGRAEAR